MKLLHYIILASFAGCLTSCDDSSYQPGKGSARDWAPEKASVAAHIGSVHAFKISPDPGSHLRVTAKSDDEIEVEFRPDVLAKLGGAKMMSHFGLESNPHTFSRSDYLFFLDALHAMLSMNATEWRGDA